MTPLRLLVVLVLVAGLSPAASADRISSRTLGLNVTQSQPTARLMAHIVPAYSGLDSTTVCGGSLVFPCSAGELSYVTEAPLSAPDGPLYFVYVLATGFDPSAGFSGVQFGIDYDGAPLTGVDVLDWTSCSVLEFPSEGFPAPGTGNMCTWFPDDPRAPVACHREPLTVVGYFTVAAFSPDVFDLTVRPVDGALKVADCGGGETLLNELAAGAAGFGRPGEDPCMIPPPFPPDPPAGAQPPIAQLFLHAAGASDPDPVGACIQASYRCADGATPPVTEMPLSSEENPEFIVYFIADGGTEYDAARAIAGTEFDLSVTGGVEILEWRPCSYWNLVGTGPLVSPPAGTQIAIGVGRSDYLPPTVIGWFRVRATSPGLLSLANPRVARRETRGYTWSAEPVWTGAIGFGGETGRGCAAARSVTGFVFPTPVQPTTWSALKSRHLR